jgi:phosphoglycerate kinase
VLIREDLNVPVKDGKVTSEQRILAALPTLRLALGQGRGVMVTSHLGRPKEGSWSAEDSLAPVAARLARSARPRRAAAARLGRMASRSRPASWCCSRTCRMNVGEGKDDERCRASTPRCATCS